MTANFYHQVRSASVIVDRLNDFVAENKNIESWTPLEFKEPHWDAALNVPDDILDQDPFLKELRSHAAFSGGILRMAPWTTYSWHRDYQRGCSVNLLLTNPQRSRCLFRHSPSGQIHGMYPIVPVPYTLTHYMCLNTQIEHSVFNWEEERFILTLHFEQELEEFTYRDLLKIVLRRR